MKAIQSPDVATFHVSIRPEGPYRVRTLDVSARRKTKLSQEERKLRDSTGRSLAFYELTHHFDALTQGPALKMSWLEYQDDQGQWIPSSPEIDVGDQFSSIQRGLLLLEEIGKIVHRRMRRHNCNVTDETFADPSLVLRALRRSRLCTEVELYEVKNKHRYWIETVQLRSNNEAAC